jgi:hypothetical protein
MRGYSRFAGTAFRAIYLSVSIPPWSDSAKYTRVKTCVYWPVSEFSVIIVSANTQGR